MIFFVCIIFIAISKSEPVIPTEGDCFLDINCNNAKESRNCSIKECNKCRNDQYCVTEPVCVDGNCVECFQDSHCNALSETCGGRCDIRNNRCFGGINCWEIYRSDCADTNGTCQPCNKRFVGHSCPTTMMVIPTTTVSTELPTESPTNVNIVNTSEGSLWDIDDGDLLVALILISFLLK